MFDSELMEILGEPDWKSYNPHDLKDKQSLCGRYEIDWHEDDGEWTVYYNSGDDGDNCISLNTELGDAVIKSFETAVEIVKHHRKFREATEKFYKEFLESCSNLS